MTVLYRAAYLRAPVAPGSRRATFVAATENPVDAGFGAEVLRMRGCDLSAYERNPVVLDSHRRVSIRDVIGVARVKVEGSKLIAEVEYLDDEDGERALAKVRAGGIRAVSIGYAIDPAGVRHVRAGQTIEGVSGPAVIVDAWRLIEVSNVPVPADAEAVKRAAYALPRTTTKPKPKPKPKATTKAKRQARRQARRKPVPRPGESFFAALLREDLERNAREEEAARRYRESMPPEHRRELERAKANRTHAARDYATFLGALLG